MNSNINKAFCDAVNILDVALICFSSNLRLRVEKVRDFLFFFFRLIKGRRLEIINPLIKCKVFFRDEQKCKTKKAQLIKKT